ncbi:hypothetical protein FI667_g15162, partial [Globisporangium splendens]
MSGVQVLADGNPRQGGMDEDERDQCIHGLLRKAKLKNSTETSSDLQELEQALGAELPEVRARPHLCLALRSLLKKQSGGLWFDEYKAIVRTAETLSGIKGWKSSCIPFAADVDGAALITDVGSRNAVFEFGDDRKGSQLVPTLLQYLEEYRNRLLSG